MKRLWHKNKETVKLVRDQKLVREDNLTNLIFTVSKYYQHSLMEIKIKFLNIQKLNSNSELLINKMTYNEDS